MPYSTIFAQSSMPGAHHPVRSTISVLTKAYCYIAYDPTGGLPVGPAYTFLEQPDSIISIANQSSLGQVAAVFLDPIIFGIAQFLVIAH